mmetsp:Transcript_60488/g.197967  ORF Transcript_60488/g.197967 Transcript_60488/m.197967 type:complete len:1657 (+) Transcript_60488:82-5052(+)
MVLAIETHESQEASSPAVGSTALVLSGATGAHAHRINGTYLLAPDGTTTYQNRERPEVWLHRVGGIWWVSDAQRKEAGAGSGWAYSHPGHLGASPPRVGIWTVDQRRGDWKAQPLTSAPCSLLEICGSAEAAWAAAVTYLRFRPVVVVRGAQGRYGALVNGTYQLEDVEPGRLPYFRHQEVLHRVLCLGTDKKWWIREDTAAIKDLKEKSQWWAHSEVVEPGVLPVDAKCWQVVDPEGRFEEQSLHLSKQTLAEAEASQATAWRRASASLRGKFLTIDGEPLDGSLLINGVYDLQPEQGEDMPPCFQHRDRNDLRVHYFASDQRWWLTSARFVEAKRPDGWACSPPVASGMQPFEAPWWSFLQQDGSWEKKDIVVVCKTAEEVEEAAVAAWRRAYEDVHSRPLLEVSGATGQNSSLINGLYKLASTGDIGKPPAFQKQDNGEVWLYAVKGRTWWFGSAQGMEKGLAAGWAHSSQFSPGTLPGSTEGAWKVFLANMWEEQSLSFEAQPSNDALEHTAGAWRRAYSEMRDHWVLEISGATGVLTNINGAYELRPSYLEKGTMTFQNRAHQGVWLYPGKDRRWWVSDSQRKDTLDAAGWACSEPVDIGALPVVAQGWNLFSGNRRWEAHSLRIRARPLKDSDPSGVLAWTSAMGELRDLPLLEISGASGDRASAVDGVYELQPPKQDQAGHPPVYRERSDKDRWLYYVPKHQSWWIGNTRRKNDLDARGWARSSRCEPGTLPQAAERWMVSAGGVWEAQPLALAARPPEPVPDEGEPLPKLGDVVLIEGAAEYILDNSMLRSSSQGVRRCLSRSLDDFHATAITNWGQTLTGTDMGDGWLQCLDQTFLPMEMSNVPVLIHKVEGEFIIDNSELQYSTKGMRQRRARRWDDLHPHAHSFWGSIIKGIDLGDGWVRISSTGLYLPTHVNGVQVVVRQTAMQVPPAEPLVEDKVEREYLLDNVRLKAATKGMRHRKGRALDDFHERAHTVWGATVRGKALGDGWLMVSDTGLYLPMFIRGIPVVTPYDGLPTERSFATVSATDDTDWEDVTTNHSLKAKSEGVQHRQPTSGPSSMFAYAVHPFSSDGTPWPIEGSRLLSIDAGDQLMLLPHAHSDVPVEWVYGHLSDQPDALGYFPKAYVADAANFPSEYLLDNSELRSASSGIRHRISKEGAICLDKGCGAPWGGTVRGIDCGDGWLRLPDGHFLPIAVNDAQVLRLKGQVVPPETAIPKDEAALPEQAVAAQDEAVLLSKEEAALPEEVQIDAVKLPRPKPLDVRADVPLEQVAFEVRSPMFGSFQDYMAPSEEDAMSFKDRSDKFHLEEDPGSPDHSIVPLHRHNYMEGSDLLAAIVEESQDKAVAAAEEATAEEVLVADAATAEEELVAEAAVADAEAQPEEQVVAALYEKEEAAAPWEEAEQSAEQLASAPSIEEGEADFIADCSLAGLSTRGIQHRLNRFHTDLHPSAGTLWGSVLRGVDLGDGWIRASSTGLFVPMELNGAQVLFPKEADEGREWRLDNSQLAAQTEGIVQRWSRDLSDRHPCATTRWGSIVRGHDTGDGWLRLPHTGLFLPMKLSAVTVIVPKVEELPRGWITAVDSETGKAYYIDRVSGTITWDRPGAPTNQDWLLPPMQHPVPVPELQSSSSGGGAHFPVEQEDSDDDLDGI